MDWEREEEDLVKDSGEGGGGIRDWCSSLTMVTLYYYNIINCINSSLEQGVSCVCVGGGGRVERRVFYKSDVCRG